MAGISPGEITWCSHRSAWVPRLRCHRLGALASPIRWCLGPGDDSPLWSSQSGAIPWCYQAVLQLASVGPRTRIYSLAILVGRETPEPPLGGTGFAFVADLSLPYSLPYSKSLWVFSLLASKSLSDSLPYSKSL